MAETTSTQFSHNRKITALHIVQHLRTTVKYAVQYLQCDGPTAEKALTTGNLED